ncbi:MAG: prolyl oligopeptidase family serine peptidase [Pirellulales bacterium]
MAGLHDDVDTAIRWVKTHAKEYKVDPERIALIGESAGGFLVSYAGAKGKDETRVAAVVAFYAPHDREFQIDKLGKLGESTTALFGITELNEESRKILRRASATDHLHARMPPYLLIHGDKDEQVPFEQSTKFQERMKKLGNTCDLITIPKGAHGMGGWAKLDSDYREKMIAWLKTTLK